jgi:hypothetical protein
MAAASATNGAARRTIAMTGFMGLRIPFSGAARVGPYEHRHEMTLL